MNAVQSVHWIHNVDEFNLYVNVTVCNMSESLTPTFPVPDPELHVFRIAEGGGIAILIKQMHRQVDIMPKPLNLMLLLSFPHLLSYSVCL